MARLTFCLIVFLMLTVPSWAEEMQVPVIFVHGNGDDASRWMNVMWLFESNGYPTARLHAIRFTDPSARSDDGKPERYRSSTTDQAAELGAAVTRMLIETGAKKVALVGSSRGGLTIRNYLRFGGGASVVSHAVLGGAPNHGVFAMDGNLGNEFNGKGTFVRALNEGTETVPGVAFLTIRSDKMDKYAQPNVGYDGPELKGATNVILPGLDHREVAFHPAAFAEMFRFITGRKPEKLTATGDAAPKVSGVVTGFGGGTATNRPLAGVHLRVFPLKADSAEREAAILDLTTDDTGRWGPLTLDPTRQYEWLMERDGRAVSYFRGTVPRSTGVMNLRFLPAPAKPDSEPQLTISRPQGYLAKDRDPVTLNGALVEQIPPGIPTRDAVTVPAPGSVVVELRGEKIHARPGVSAKGELNIAEFRYD